MKKVGIYKIEVLRPDGTTAVYVGQSANINGRLAAHRHLLRSGKHSNTHMSAAWKKYGEQAFRFAVLDQCTADVLDDYEEFWIEVLGARWDRGGFNQRPVAPSNRGLKKSAEAIEKSASFHRGRKRSAETAEAISRAHLARGVRPSKAASDAGRRAQRGQPRPGRTAAALRRKIEAML